MCKGLLTLDTIKMAFNSNDTRQKERITSCFYSCWYQSFSTSARIMYRSYSSNYVDEIADLSFTDGLITFIEKAKAGDLYHGEASVKSIAFAFFRNKLFEHIRNNKAKLVFSDEIVDSIPDSPSNDVLEKEMLMNCLEKAKSELQKEDANICTWKYEKKLSNSEIASALNITTASFTNRLYRLTIRLEKLVKACLNSGHEYQ
jgi:RNA polymerase sigma factor (sigma-70 family)